MTNELLLVRRGLSPGEASRVAIAHNALFHPSGDGAHIDVDKDCPLLGPDGTPQMPYYQITCSVCGGLVIAGTGHRPGKVNGSYNRLIDLAKACINLLMPSWVISGMALGWDMALAQAAWELECPFVAAMPFKGYMEEWSLEDRRRCALLVDAADKIINVCEPGYEAIKYQIRNEWMVDRATMVLALWNGSKGGTANTVNYALQKRVPVRNVWNSWVKGR